MIPEFVTELRSTLSRTGHAGFWVSFVNSFLGKDLQHGDVLRKLSLFRIGYGEYEQLPEQRWSHLDMEVHEHPILGGTVGQLRTRLGLPMVEKRSNPLLGVTRNIHPGKQTATCGSKLRKPNRGKLSTSASDSNIATLIGSGSLISISFSRNIRSKAFSTGEPAWRFALSEVLVFPGFRLR